MYTAIFIISQLCIFNVIASGYSSSNATTANIDTIFQGRCLEYVQLKSPGGLERKNCSHLFNIFQAAFLKNTQCGDDYSQIFRKFFKAVNPGSTPQNEALFWSGTMDVAHDISQVNAGYLTLEDTFPGFIANGLTFCGEGVIGFNYKQCNCKWDQSQEKAFWKAASTQFARNARGIVSVLVNGTRTDGRDAYSNTSMFATVELPNLNTTAVKLVKVLVGMDLNRKPKEKCGTKSIKRLSKDLEARNLRTICIDEPSLAYDVLCTKYPRTVVCKRYTKKLEEENKLWKIIGIAAICACGLLLIIFAVIYCCIRRNRSYSKNEI